MYNEAMLYEAQGRYEDGFGCCRKQHRGKGQSVFSMPSRRRSLAVLYQQLGQLYRERKFCGCGEHLRWSWAGSVKKRIAAQGC